MKKVLATIAVSTALVMGGAVVASAAGIEMDGSIRVRGISNKTGQGETATVQGTPPSVNYDQRVRLGMKSKPSDNLTGYISLETGTTGENINWAQDTGNVRSKAGTEMRLAQAWIDYKPSTWGIKVGLDNINLGHNTFFDHRGDAPDPAIQLYTTLAGTAVKLMSIKMQENTVNDNTSDLDAYMLTLNRKFSDNFTGGLNYTYLQGGSDTQPNNDTNPGLALSNLGLTANLKFGDLSFALAGDTQFGTMRDTGAANNKVDAKGYAVRLAGTYNIGKSSLGLLFAQGSGDDNATDNKADTYQNFLFSTAYDSYMAGFRQAVPGSTIQANAANGIGNGNRGLSNLTIYQVNAATSTTCALTGKPLALRGALNFLETTEDVTINTAGGRDNDLGTELFVVAAWSLTKNLSYQIEGAYLWAGDAWRANATGGAYDGTTTNTRDNYFLRHGISMSF